MKKHKTIFLCTGAFMLLTEVWKQWCLTYRLGGGQYNWWYFPFQLCSIPMYVCLLFPFLSSDKLRSPLLAFLMDYGLLAGIFTFFDTSGLHYSYAPLTVHSYAWHVLLIVLGIYAGYVNVTCMGKAASKHTAFAGATAAYLICCILATVCNLVFYRYGSINMFYISPHYRMTQKVFRHIALLFGNGTGIIVYMCAIITGAFFVHLLWRRIRKVKIS